MSIFGKVNYIIKFCITTFSCHNAGEIDKFQVSKITPRIKSQLYVVFMSML